MYKYGENYCERNEMISSLPTSKVSAGPKGRLGDSLHYFHATYSQFSM